MQCPKIIILIALFSIQILKAQNQPFQAIKSPNVAAMERFGDIPVNLFTGTPDISIPLHQIETGNIRIPIGLRYHASSVKPNQPPGWVGLGWDLDCAGSITRQVRGAYDEYEYPLGSVLTIYNGKNYLTLGASNLDSDSNWLNATKMYNVYYDSNSTYGDQQADEFYFNFSGHSGKFYYSGPTKGWVVASTEKIKIEVNGLLTPNEIIGNALYAYNSNEPIWYRADRITDFSLNQTKFIKEFTLITSDGTRYTFGGIDATEFTTSFTTPEGIFQDIPYGNINLSSWLLKKIVDTNGKVMTYTYRRDYPNLSLSHYCSAYSNNISDQSTSWQACLSGVCLDNFGKVTFDLGAIFGGYGIKGSSYSSSSQLINPYRLNGNFVFPMYLENITTDTEIVSFSSSPAITLNFNDAQFSGGSHSWEHPGELDVWKNNIKWNKLVSIDIKSTIGSTAIIKKYLFEYFENPHQRFSLSSLNILGSDLVPYQKYEFQYNDLAGLQSTDGSPLLYGGNYTDHWGFFNGKNIRSNLETAFSDRDSDPNFVTKGILSQIKYPTGGTTSFIWEAHQHSRVLSDSKNELVPYIGFAGGSRIKEINSYSDVGVLASQKKYYYVTGYNATSNPTTLASSGVLNGKPKYTFSFNNYPGQINGITNFSFKIFSLNSFTNNNPVGNGSHIGYDEVVEVNLDHSYTKHYFTNYGIDLNGVPHFDATPIGITGWRIGEQSVYMPFSSLEGERGKEISTLDYNSNDVVVKKVKYIFRNDSSRFLDYLKQKIVSNGYNSDTSGDALMFSVAIKNFYYVYYPISKEVTNYDLAGLNPITTIENFSYNSNNQVSEVALINSKAERLSTKYFYPQDFINEPFMQQLVDANRIVLPISTNKYIFSNMLFKDKTTYAKDATTSNLLLPKSTYAAKFPNSITPITTPNVGALEKKVTYDKYDDKGNILQYTPVNGTPVSIIWGYNRTQPIAKIENAAYATIPAATIINLQSLSDADNDNCTTTTCKEQLLRNGLKALRSSLSTNTLVTTYTHNPLVGVTSITDLKGLTTYYEYDSFNRLKFIKDQDQNILQRNCYNYKGQVIDCSQIGLIAFSSVTKSGSYTSSCAAGSIGSLVTYTVAAGAYISTISQADADAKAQTDVTTNGQNYANVNGICTPIIPTVPKGLTFSSAASSSLNFTWTAVSGATGYKIYKNGVYVSSTTTASGSLSGLASSTAYGVQVLAFNGAGDSALCSTVSMTTTASYTYAGSIINNTGHAISAGTMKILVNDTQECSLAMPSLAAGATFQFSTVYSSPIYNGTFILKLYSTTVGIAGTNYFKMMSGSSATSGLFSNQGWGWQATATSTGPQYVLILQIF